MSDAHQAPVSEKQDIDLFSSEDPVSPDRVQLGVDSAPLVDGAVEDLGADDDSVEDPIREDLLRRRRLTLAHRPISALARSRLVASADEAPLHSSDNQPEDEEAPATSAEYSEFFHSAILVGFNTDEAADYALEKCSGEINVNKNKFYALSEETLCEDFWNQIGYQRDLDGGSLTRSDSSLATRLVPVLDLQTRLILWIGKKLDQSQINLLVQKFMLVLLSGDLGWFVLEGDPCPNLVRQLQ
jgi:hypothetical protein